MVTLAEDLFLLACDEVTGRARIPTTYLDLGLGGALLLDLVLRDRLALVDEHVAVVAPAPTGDSLLDAALSAVADSAKWREPEYWVRHLAKYYSRGFTVSRGPRWMSSRRFRLRGYEE